MARVLKYPEPIDQKRDSEMLQQGMTPLASFCVSTLQQQGKTLGTFDVYQLNKLATNGFLLEQELNEPQKRNDSKVQHYNKLCQKLEEIKTLIREYISAIDILLSYGIEANNVEVVTMDSIQRFVERFKFLAATFFTVHFVYRKQ